MIIPSFLCNSYASQSGNAAVSKLVIDLDIPLKFDVMNPKFPINLLEENKSCIIVIHDESEGSSCSITLSKES